MTIGLLTAEKARVTGDELGAAGGGENASVASGQEIVIGTVPYASQASTSQASTSQASTSQVSTLQEVVSNIGNAILFERL